MNIQEPCKQEATEDIGLRADLAKACMIPRALGPDLARVHKLRRDVDTVALAAIEEVVCVIEIH